MKGIITYHHMKKIKSLHVDLTINNPGRELMNLQRRLDEPIVPKLTSLSLTVADKEFDIKYAELIGEKQNFRIAQFAKDHNPADSAIVVDELVRRLEHTGTRMVREGNQRIVSIRGLKFVYDDGGLIIDGEAKGHDALHYMACNIKQDLAVVIRKGESLIYDFDSSMFEKTPKDLITGENRFLGKDLLKFHAKAKTYGMILPIILDKLALRLERKDLDLLTIDLRGTNVYSNGKIKVVRFERDYIIPIQNGILAYANVFFQKVNESRSPYNGGLAIDLNNFNKKFQVMKNE